MSDREQRVLAKHAEIVAKQQKEWDDYLVELEEVRAEAAGREYEFDPRGKIRGGLDSDPDAVRRERRGKDNGDGSA